MTRRPPSSPLFPYTTLSRSQLRLRPDLRYLVPAATGVLPLRLRRQAVLDAVLPLGRQVVQLLQELLGIDPRDVLDGEVVRVEDRKSTRLNSSHSQISYAVFC